MPTADRSRRLRSAVLKRGPIRNPL